MANRVLTNKPTSEVVIGRVVNNAWTWTLVPAGGTITVTEADAATLVSQNPSDFEADLVVLAKIDPVVVDHDDNKGDDLVVTVSGKGFTEDSVVAVGALSVETDFVDEETLTVTIDKDDWAAAWLTGKSVTVTEDGTTTEAIKLWVE
jgi:hypothetical protein